MLPRGLIEEDVSKPAYELEASDSDSGARQGQQFGVNLLAGKFFELSGCTFLSLGEGFLIADVLLAKKTRR